MSTEGQHAVTTSATSARSLAELKAICKAHGIKNTVDYKQQPFYSSVRPALEFKVRKLESEYEGAAKKMDMFLCDLQSAYKLIQQCQLVALFKARLKSWEKVIDLINGHLKLSDLVGPEKIEPSELDLITSDAVPALSQVPS